MSTILTQSPSWQPLCHTPSVTPPADQAHIPCRSAGLRSTCQPPVAAHQRGETFTSSPGSTALLTRQHILSLVSSCQRIHWEEQPRQCHPILLPAETAPLTQAVSGGRFCIHPSKLYGIGSYSPQTHLLTPSLRPIHTFLARYFLPELWDS